jgi:hypothetical protein
MVYLTMLYAVQTLSIEWLCDQWIMSWKGPRKNEVLTAVVIKITISWDVIRSPVRSLMFQRYVLPLSLGSKIRSSKLHLQLASFSLISNMEAVRMFLWNAGDLLDNNATPHKLYNSSTGNDMQVGSCWDLNMRHPKYETGKLPTQLQC